MSQKLVFDLLKELGGKATSSEIIALAKKKYPDLTLYQYVGLRLSKLMKWKYIDYIYKRDYSDGKRRRHGYYIILEEYEPDKPLTDPPLENHIHVLRGSQQCSSFKLVDYCEHIANEWNNESNDDTGYHINNDGKLCQYFASEETLEINFCNYCGKKIMISSST